MLSWIAKGNLEGDQMGASDLLTSTKKSDGSAGAL